MNEKLAIITVNYNTYRLSHELCASLQKQNSDDFHLFIVDVSQKKKKVMVPRFAEVIKSKNKGYAAGVNEGVHSAMKNGYSRFVIVNNDVEVAGDFIKSCIAAINSNPKSIIGGKVYYYRGYEYHKDRYSKKDEGRVIWYAGGLVDWKNAFTLHRGVDEVDRGQYNEFEKTDFITGCLMCFDKAVFEEIGMLDEAYFLYFEDADWCERAKHEGIELYYDPTIVIWHKNAQSTGGVGSTIHQKYMARNRLRFGLKYAPFKTKLHLIKNYFGDVLLKY